MAGETTTTLDPVLKDFYLPGIVEGIVNGNPILARLEEKKKAFSGRRAIQPFHSGRSEGVGSIGEEGDLPAAGNEVFVDEIWLPKIITGRIRVTGLAMAETRNGQGAYLRAWDTATKFMGKNVRDDFSRMLWGNGSGVLARCGTTSASSTVVVVSTKNLRKNMVVDIIVTSTGATGTGAVARRIASIPSATTFTIDGGAITTDSTFSVYRTGSRILDIFGLRSLEDTNPPDGAPLFGSIDRTTEPLWKGNRLHNSGTPRAISENLMRAAIDESEIQGDGKISIIATNHAIKRGFGDLLIAQKQHVNTKKLAGGYSSIIFDDIPIVADRRAYNGETGILRRLYFLDESVLSILQVTDGWEWDSKGGSIVKDIAGKDCAEAFIKNYCQFKSEECAVHTILDDISE